MSTTVMVSMPGAGLIKLPVGTAAIIGYPPRSAREQVLMTVPGERWHRRADRYLQDLADDGYTILRVVTG